MHLRRQLFAAAVFPLMFVAGCGSDTDPADDGSTQSGHGSHSGHQDHGSGQADGGHEGHGGHDGPGSHGSHGGHSGASAPVGDGTTAEEVGYSLSGLRLPDRPGAPGKLAFRVEYQGEPQTRFLVEQTKRMHTFVVREDLAVFRHVHPTMAADGMWSMRLTLPEPGRYRVITEFVAEDAGGGGDHLLLGTSGNVGGDWQRAKLPAPADQASANGVTVEVMEPIQAGDETAVKIGIRHGDRAPELGTYLGTYSHVTGFHAGSGSVIHMHPLGPPDTVGDTSVLSFHAGIPQPGTYRLFIQMRIDGMVHTVPITLAAS